MKICGHEYKVVIGNFYETSMRQDDPMYFGHVNYVKKLIHIYPGMDRLLREEILIHEVLHAITFHTNISTKQDEQMISALGNGLSQMGVGKTLWKLAFPKEKK